MEKPDTRLESFSDGVFAIALTLLIIDVKIPNLHSISSTAEMWQALKDIAPVSTAFLMSFAIILITWVNHHRSMKLLNTISYSFIYANGFLLLTVVIMPFPTTVLGETLFTNHASPGVMLYSAINALQAFAWFVAARVAVKDGLAKNDVSLESMKKNSFAALYSIGIYAVLFVLAIWFPLAIAIVISLLWIVWLVYGLNIKHE